MTHRAEVLFLYSTDLDADLGEFESATEARAVCARYEGDVLSWSQPEEEVWEAQGLERWYQVTSR